MDGTRLDRQEHGAFALDALRRHGVVLGDERQVRRTARLVFEPPCVLGRVAVYSHASFGRYTYFRNGRVDSLASIGRFCSVGPEVAIGQGNHPLTFSAPIPSSTARRRCSTSGQASAPCSRVPTFRRRSASRRR
ncbi:MAG TPA: hypothetical protein VGN83_02325 [Falsiroseomonas sp.]|nr:hypothetical protein [Falsiroseomonas sp.]